jgi:hypothetical protein
MPIRGSFAGASARAYGLGAGVQIGDFESIATVTVSTATPTITFSSIPATYSHLQIRALVRASGASDYNDARVRFNSDTASNYAGHQLFGDGSTAASNAEVTAANIFFTYCPAASSSASIFAPGILDILDYADTNKYKTVKSIHGSDRSGSGYSIMRSGHWRSTAAINTIGLYFPDGANFVQYSSFALYGVKA